MSGPAKSGSTLCIVQQQQNNISKANTNERPQLKVAMMARNSSLGENVPPNGGAETSRQQNHLAPPPVTPESPRPQKGDPRESPLAAVGSLTIPLPKNQTENSTN